MTPDGPPILGLGRHRNLFFNTGHGHMGWTMACGTARIVADRERNGAFGSPEGLDRVPGIGPKILDRIRPFFAPAASLDVPAPAADSVSPNAN